MYIYRDLAPSVVNDSVVFYIPYLSWDLFTVPSPIHQFWILHCCVLCFLFDTRFTVVLMQFLLFLMLPSCCVCPFCCPSTVCVLVLYFMFVFCCLFVSSFTVFLLRFLLSFVDFNAHNYVVAQT